MQENTKRQAILDAAHDQFSQYGFRKTSMDDIARSLGISRASLYSHFENKDEIFRCVSVSIHERALDKANRLLQDSEKNDLTERVANALLARHGPFQRAVVESQHGAELYDEYSRLCGEVVIQSQKRFESMLASTLRSAARTGEIDLKKNGLSAANAAELLNLSAAGLKRGASDMKSFETRVRRLAKVLIAGLMSATG
jgi:AcrR family transcriptional regulator